MTPFEPQRRTYLTRQGATIEVERSGAIELGAAGAPQSFAPGELLSGRYRVIEQLGEGGMGQVYRVADSLHPERALALKTLARVRQRALVELLKAEFRTMAQLAHPNIARVYDFETLANGESFFTMELVEGRDLVSASASQPLEQIVDWTVQACRALQYLHSRGVIHADVKPHNLLVTASGVKLLDFGLSGAVDAGLVLGTPAYMAPELLAGRPPDERTDLYALGITLYQLVFSRVPFSADTIAGLAQQHQRTPLSFPRESPLNRVIERLCQKRREERPANANEVIDALGDAIERRYVPDTSETRRSYVSSGRLVGRERERQQLLDHCFGDSEVGLIAVSGPSGVGKSRLLAELRRQLQLSGVPMVDAACYEGSFSDLAPLIDWNRALCALGRANGRAELVEAHAGALAWLDGFPSAHDAGRDEESLRLGRLRALVSFVAELSRTVRFVLHLDDLQWARSSTIDFLRLLYEELAVQAEARRPSRLRILVSYRDDEVESRPIAELLAATPRRLSLSLAPLDHAQTMELIGALLGAPEVPEIFSARVLHETGGNPFFIEEVLRALLERGDLYLQAGRWAAPIDPAHVELPRTIAAVLERRLETIDPGDRELLDWLAVYAQPMPLSLLAACHQHTLEEVRARTARMAERHMVTADEHERVRLAHDKLRECLSAQIPRERRVARHLHIARTLEAAADEGQLVFECAHHFWHAGDAAGASRWAERAAELGERLFATDAAVDNYERLRRLRPSEGERWAATERLLTLSLVAGHYGRILEVTEEELPRRSSSLDRGWLLQLQGEALGSLGRLAEASERLRSATALLGARAPRGRRARRLFIAYHYVRHLLTLRRGRTRAAELDPDERRRREILGFSYFLLSVYALLLGDEEGIGFNFAAYDQVLPLGPGELRLRITQNVALCHHLLGRYWASERLILEAKEMASSETDRASVLVTELLARQSTQQPIFAGQKPVYEYEAQLLGSLGLLSTRSKALYLHLARVVATTTVWQFAQRFRDRPEVTRWAEAMRGTVHYTIVQGSAAAMALIAGDRPRAEQGWARAAEADATPFYRAWLDANFAWGWAVAGDRTQALRCLRSLSARLASLETRTATALPILALLIAAALAVEASGAEEPWLRACLDDGVRRLERRRRLPPYLEFFRAAGRLRLGRGSLRELSDARRRSRERWQIEQPLAGHTDGCVAAALALRLSSGSKERAAAADYAAEAMRIVEERYPPAYAARVRELLGPAVPETARATTSV